MWLDLQSRNTRHPVLCANHRPLPHRQYVERHIARHNILRHRLSRRCGGTRSPWRKPIGGRFRSRGCPFAFTQGLTEIILGHIARHRR
jgi:hypothetical protein